MSAITKRDFIKGAGAAGLASTAGCLGRLGSEGEFPSEDFTFVIPEDPGGGFDNHVRFLIGHMERLGVVPTGIRPENISGAAARTATSQVFEADPDGYTFMITWPDGLSRFYLQGAFDYDITEMTHLTHVNQTNTNIMTGKESGIETWDEFVSAAQNDELMFGTPGPQGHGALTPYTVGKLGGAFDEQTVIDNRVIYDEPADWIQGIIRGDVDVFTGSDTTILEHIEHLNPIVEISNSDNLSPLKPSDVQEKMETLKTAGVDNAQKIADLNGTLRVISGPPEIPADRVEFIEGMFEQTMTDEETMADAKENAIELDYGDADFASDRVAATMDAWEENLDIYGELAG